MLARGGRRRWRDASSALEARADALLAAGDTDGAQGEPRDRRINAALMKQERALITRRGLPGRPWFRHQVFAPGLVTGYAVQFLPGMRDAIEAGDDEKTARTYRDLLIDSLREAAGLARRADRLIAAALPAGRRGAPADRRPGLMARSSPRRS